MVQLNSWQYCEASTKSHPLAKVYTKHLQSINEILFKEGVKTEPFKNEVALNLDEVEKTKASNEKRSKRKTVDLSFCVTKLLKNERASKPKTVLTELKLNLKSRNNINVDAKDLDDKVNHSIALLSREIPIFRKYLLVINDTLSSQSENRLKRKLSNNPKYKVLSVKEFHQSYFKYNRQSIENTA